MSREIQPILLRPETRKPGGRSPIMPYPMTPCRQPPPLRSTVFPLAIRRISAVGAYFPCDSPLFHAKFPIFPADLKIVAALGILLLAICRFSIRICGFFPRDLKISAALRDTFSSDSPLLPTKCAREEGRLANRQADCKGLRSTATAPLLDLRRGVRLTDGVVRVDAAVRVVDPRWWFAPHARPIGSNRPTRRAALGGDTMSEGLALPALPP